MLQDYERLVQNLLILLIAAEVGNGSKSKIKRLVIKAPPWCAPQIGIIADRDRYNKILLAGLDILVVFRPIFLFLSLHLWHCCIPLSAFKVFDYTTCLLNHLRDS